MSYSRREFFGLTASVPFVGLSQSVGPQPPASAPSPLPPALK